MYCAPNFPFWMVTILTIIPVVIEGDWLPLSLWVGFNVLVISSSLVIRWIEKRKGDQGPDTA